MRKDQGWQGKGVPRACRGAGVHLPRSQGTHVPSSRPVTLSGRRQVRKEQTPRFHSLNMLDDAHRSGDRKQNDRLGMAGGLGGGGRDSWR